MEPRFFLQQALDQDTPLLQRMVCLFVSCVRTRAMQTVFVSQACATPAMGTVIGKAVEDFVGASGTIEIAVGRL